MIKSFGWIIYFMKDWEPLFLVLKRQTVSKKIEWTSPKGKAKKWEDPVETAKREIFEETNLDPNLLRLKEKLWDFLIQFPDNVYKKKVTYFLFEYLWDPNSVKVSDCEWYIWVYQWFPIKKIINLIPYRWLRELYRKAYKAIMGKKVKA